ncbi:hypothetical protein BLNAU_4757 [Blattamonas nauphoetae]|uniref:Uncharacterized protein n=1 Tax=Blattamonas nauphoetae TaxID=2049346 RepID=A0ABQ9Y929_9EUKA|nr:hypothetical protein BLNAU_4757 [Blattamonas nauphoetae]
MISAFSAKALYALVQADLIPQLVITLDPLSLSFPDCGHIHACLILSISKSTWLASLIALDCLEIEHSYEDQALFEMVLKQVLLPSERYIRNLCENRHSIVDGGMSANFLILLAQLLQISPYNRPFMDLVLNMPVILAIPSCLSFFDIDYSIWTFLRDMTKIELEWDRKEGECLQSATTLLCLLRMEGLEDAING